MGIFKTPAPAAPTLGGLFVIHQDGAVCKMLHTRRGRLEREGEWGSWPVRATESERFERFAALAGAHEASWVVAAEVGSLDEVMERFGARARRDDDLIAQSLSLVMIVREMMGEGRIEGWPRRLKNVPIPTHPVVTRTLDAVCEVGRAIVLGVFKDGVLWTALALRRGPRGFDRVLGPDELRRGMGLLSGDWRRDLRHLVEAVEERLAPLALGCFGEEETLVALQTDGRAGAWSRAVVVRDVVLSPMPLAVGAALGFDTARYAWGTVRSVAPAVLSRWSAPLALFEPAIHAVRKRALGGFSPLEILRALRGETK